MSTCENARLHSEGVSPSAPTPHKDFPMDAEHINLIGSTLEDLGERTEDLRRYL